MGKSFKEIFILETVPKKLKTQRKTRIKWLFFDQLNPEPNKLFFKKIFLGKSKSPVKILGI